MLVRCLILHFILLSCSGLSFAQARKDILDSEPYRISAIKKVEQYRDDLIVLVSSRNSPKKSTIINQIQEDVFAEDSDIEDDLNPNIKNPSSDFRSVGVYLNDFSMFFVPDKEDDPLFFTGIKATGLEQGERYYVEVLFQSNFKGVRDGADKVRFVSTYRLATVVFEDPNDPLTAKILTIKYANRQDIEQIILYSDSLDRILNETRPNDLLRQRKNEELYSDYIHQGDAAFINKAYLQAEKLYRKALIYKPNDFYANEQINDILKIRKREQDFLAYLFYLSSAKLEFENRRYESSILLLDSAETLIPQTDTLKSLRGIYMKKYRKELSRKSARYLGVNYNLIEFSTRQPRTLPDQIRDYQHVFNWNRFGVSLYRPVGAYISSISLYNKKLPGSIYTKSQMESIVRSLRAQSIDFQELAFVGPDKREWSFDAGINIMINCNIFLKVGSRISGIESWDLYSGDLKGWALKSDLGSPFYALDWRRILKADAQAGMALVFRYVQVESVWNMNIGSVEIKGGMNIPLKKKPEIKK